MVMNNMSCSNEAPHCHFLTTFCLTHDWLNAYMSPITPHLIAGPHSLLTVHHWHSLEYILGNGVEYREQVDGAPLLLVDLLCGEFEPLHHVLVVALELSDARQPPLHLQVS